MSSPKSSFAELVARVRQGDVTAMDSLVRQYESEVRLVARLRLGAALRPYLDSMDLVQSVHRSLIVGLKQDKYELNEPGQLIALALTIVRRKAARHWRKLQRQDRASGSRMGEDNLPTVLRNLADSTDHPGASVTLDDTVQALCKSLSPDEKRLLEMHLEGYRTSEVAEKLGENADVLRVKLSRLRAKLRATGLVNDWL